MIEDLAVYIHIPFCTKKCAYCDFLSAPPKEGQVDDYIKALKAEISLYAEYADNFTIRTIFIGGGTPSLIEASYIKYLLDELRITFEERRAGSYEPEEITIECNPGTVSFEKFLVYRQSGINRISMGLQSSDDKELALLGRIHKYDDWCNSMEQARKAGFDNINVDLISGIPGQHVKEFTKTLEHALKYSPEHISVYSLIIEEGTQFYDIYRRDRLSDSQIESWEEEDRKIYEATKKILSEYDYQRYEISNYSKSGYECKHNLVYWERGSYIGIGIGSASMIDNVRFSNTRMIDRYFEYSGSLDDNGMLMIHDNVEELSIKDQMTEFIILGLRKTSGISCIEFKNEYNIDIFEVYGDVINKWTSLGYLIMKSDRLFCSEDGLNICNRIMIDFIL